MTTSTRRRRMRHVGVCTIIFLCLLRSTLLLFRWYHRLDDSYDYLSRADFIFEPVIVTTTTTTTTTAAKNDKKKDEDKKPTIHKSSSSSCESILMRDNIEYSNNNDRRIKVMFFDDTTTTTNTEHMVECWISLECVTFLRCGEDGHAFKTTMDCITTTTDTSNTTTITKTTTARNTAVANNGSNNIQRRNVVLKVQTTTPPYPNRNISANTYKCISEPESKLQIYKRTYQQLLFQTSSSSSSSKTSLHRKNVVVRDERFHPPIGSVPVPVNQLYSNVVNNISEVKKLCGQLVHIVKLQQQQQQHQQLQTLHNNNNDVESYGKGKEEEEEDLVVVGTIMEVAKGKKVEPRKILDRNSSRRIVNNLICMWQHMYQHDFIHDDISFPHIYDDGIITSLIDFSRHKTLTWKIAGWNNNENYEDGGHDDKYFENDDDPYEIQRHNNKMRQLQILQLYQVMTLIGNICMRQSQYIELPYSIFARYHDNRVWMKQENISKLRLAFKKCNFDDDDHKDIHHHTTQASSSTTSILDLPSFLFDYFKEVKRDKNTTFVVISSDRRNSTPTTNDTTIITNDGGAGDDDDIVGSMYQLLSQWSGGECIV